MTKRKDLLKTIKKYAKTTGQNYTETEGANHTKIWVGDNYTTIPRHNEIPNTFAKKILKDLGATE